MRKEAANTWGDGLMMDSNPINTPNSVLTDCLNGTFLTYDGNEMVLQNDKGNYRLKGSELSPNFIPVGIASYGDILYVISYNPITEKSEIGSFPSPNTVIASNLDNSLDVESILTQAFRYDNNDVTWTKTDLEDKYKKDFIFYGIENDLTINPGDTYCISSVPNCLKYERLNYSIFSNAKSYPITPITDGKEHKVSWEVAGYLKCNYELPTVEELHIYPMSLTVPSKYEDDGGVWKLNGTNLNTTFALSFQTNDELVKKAINNGDVVIKYTAKYGDDANLVNGEISSFKESNFSASSVYFNNNVNLNFPFEIDTNGNIIYDSIDIKAGLYINMHSGDKTKLVLFDSASYTIAVSNSPTDLNVKIADEIFQYTYNNNKLNIKANLKLAALPDQNFIITARLGKLKYENNKMSSEWESLSDNLYRFYTEAQHCIEFEWPTEINSNFYALELIAKSNKEELYKVRHFIIADKTMNRFASDDVRTVVKKYKIFDQIPASEIFSNLSFSGNNITINSASLKNQSSESTISATPSEISKYASINHTYKELLLANDASNKDVTITETKTGEVSGKVGFTWGCNYDIFNNFTFTPINEDSILNGTFSNTIKYRIESCTYKEFLDRSISSIFGADPSERLQLYLLRKSKDEYSKNMKSSDGTEKYGLRNDAAKHLYYIQLPNTDNPQLSYHNDFDNVEDTISTLWADKMAGGLGYLNLKLHCKDRLSETGIAKDRLYFGNLYAAEDFLPIFESTLLIGQNASNRMCYFPIYTSGRYAEQAAMLDRLKILTVDSSKPKITGWQINRYNYTGTGTGNVNIKIDGNFNIKSAFLKNTSFEVIKNGAFTSNFIAAIEEHLLENVNCTNIRELPIFKCTISSILTESLPVTFSDLKSVFETNVAFVKNNSAIYDVNKTGIYYDVYPTPSSNYFKAKTSDTNASFAQNDFNQLKNVNVTSCNSYIAPNGNSSETLISWGKWGEDRFFDLVLHEQFLEKPWLFRVHVYKNVEDFANILPGIVNMEYVSSKNECLFADYATAASIAMHKDEPTAFFVNRGSKAFVFVPQLWETLHPNETNLLNQATYNGELIYQGTTYITNLPEGVPVILKYKDSTIVNTTVQTHLKTRTLITKLSYNFSAYPNCNVLPSQLLETGDYMYCQYGQIENQGGFSILESMTIDFEKIKSNSTNIKSLFWDYYAENSNFKTTIPCN